MLQENGYEYVAIVFGTIYLIPQIIVSKNTKCLDQISTLSLITLIFSSMLWAYYLYSKVEAVYYAYATGFVCSNALALLIMKYMYYVQHLKKEIEEVRNPV